MTVARLRQELSEPEFIDWIALWNVEAAEEANRQH